jgi:hypothetical protein
MIGINAYSLSHNSSRAHHEGVNALANNTGSPATCRLTANHNTANAAPKASAPKPAPPSPKPCLQAERWAMLNFWHAPI